MRRRFFKTRPKKNYLWLTQAFNGGFESSDVLELPLIDGGNELFGSTGQTRQRVNLQRIITSSYITVNTNDLNTEELFIYGAVDYWLYITDRDTAAGRDPSDPAVVADEKTLAWGTTEAIGHLAVDSAFIGGTGSSNAYATSVKPSMVLKLDVKTNREFSSDDVLVLALTRFAATGLSALDGTSFQSHTLSRVLYKVP